MKNQVRGILESTTIEGGQGAKGQWQKLTAVIQTQEKYPKKVAVIFWNEKADEVSRINKGADVTFDVNIESRDYNGRWFTDVRGYNFYVNPPQVQYGAVHTQYQQAPQQPLYRQVQQQPAPQQPAPQPMTPKMTSVIDMMKDEGFEMEQERDLPF